MSADGAARADRAAQLMDQMQLIILTELPGMARQLEFENARTKRAEGADGTRGADGTDGLDCAGGADGDRWRVLSGLTGLTALMRALLRRV